jgi:hypothetical protein
VDAHANPPIANASVNTLRLAENTLITTIAARM